MKAKEYQQAFGCACCRNLSKKDQRKLLNKRSRRDWKREWSV